MLKFKIQSFNKAIKLKITIPAILQIQLQIQLLETQHPIRLHLKIALN